MKAFQCFKSFYYLAMIVYSIKRKFVDIEKEYNVFRKNNKLIGPAKYPKNLVGYVEFGLLFFIELYINAFFRDSHLMI